MNNGVNFQKRALKQGISQILEETFEGSPPEDWSVYLDEDGGLLQVRGITSRYDAVVVCRRMKGSRAGIRNASPRVYPSSFIPPIIFPQYANS